MTGSSSDDVASEKGFGLVEIIVAMALLLIISLAMLPIFVSALHLSEDNVSLTTSTQLVSEQMDLARGLPQTCAALEVFAERTVSMTIEDPHDTVLEFHRSLETGCPASYPGTVVLRAWVTVEGSTVVLAEAETRIHLKSEH